MRKLRKIEKPDILANNAHIWEESLTECIKQGKEIPDSLRKKYSHKDVKEALLKETHKKCAYCESLITHIDYGDIEHIIPKSIFPEKTFEWENLTIACGKCNQNKSNYYSETLPLINPYLDNPEDEIIFYGPVPVYNSYKGRITISKLKLDRVDLLEKRAEKLKDISPLRLEYLNTKDELLKSYIYNDLLEYTNDSKEYSSMIRCALTDLEKPSMHEQVEL